MPWWSKYSSNIEGVTIAVYNQYWGGNHAIVAKAIHWGKTIIAQVIQAIISALITFLFFNSGNHLVKGVNLSLKNLENLLIEISMSKKVMKIK